MQNYDEQTIYEIWLEQAFKLRDWATEYEAEALAAGKTREAATWASRRQDMDAHIRKYGLVRNAKSS